MTTERAEPTLGEAQARVRADHVRIRSLLDELGSLLTQQGPEGAATGSSKQLAEAIWRLFLLLDDHLAMEERDLAPLFERAGVWGKVQVQRLHEEHRQQRTTLLAMVDECDGKTKGESAIVDDARWLIESLRRDIDHEEREFDAVREDGFVVDQCTG